MASSVYIIIFMTINRYISIYKPTDFQRLHTAQNAKIHISLSFLAGIFLHIPLCFQNKVVLIENGTCPEHHYCEKHIFINFPCVGAGAAVYSAEERRDISSSVVFKLYIMFRWSFSILHPYIWKSLFKVGKCQNHINSFHKREGVHFCVL